MGKEGPRRLKSEISLPYEWSYGPTAERFFDEFKEKRIMGNRCPECERILVPPRDFCPRCFVDMGEWVEVSDEGEILTSTCVAERMEFTGQPKKPPYGLAIIKLDGADVGLSHILGGIDFSDPEKAMDKVSPGTRVKAVWRDEREGKISDIEYFEPV